MLLLKAESIIKATTEQAIMRSLQRFKESRAFNVQLENLFSAIFIILEFREAQIYILFSENAESSGSFA